jgi:small-conductance mechanosensitive channel
MLRTRDLGYYDPAPPGRYAGRGYLDRGWPPPPLREVQARWLRWLCLALAALGAWAFVAYVVRHDDARPGLSAQGWTTLLAAALALVLLSVRYYRRGALAAAATVAEYAVVALLAVLLTLTATGVPLPSSLSGQATKQATAKQRAGHAGGHAANAATAGKAAGKQAAHGCPAVWKVPAWVGCLWRQAQDAYKPKPKQGHALPLSPTPSTSTRRTA